MKFMLLIMNGDPENPPIKETDYPAIFAQFQKVTAELQAQGKFLHSARLRPETRTVRAGRDGNRTVTDGPFLETKEMVGGYFMIECPSEAEALEWAKKLPPFFNFQARQVWEM
ncbi:MAG: hypothetical protein JO121_05945 [Deltaproteobacteria bacterium]|jgi:hypothetical protein|nr:hypothetical protein [Deltaproteobacteria bacterium]